MAEERYPILGRGEVYSAPISVRPSGGTKRSIRTFEEARLRLLPQFENLLRGIHSFDSTDLLLDRKVFFQVSLDYEYLAKSYFPSNLVRSSGWEMVGSRPWQQEHRDQKAFQEPKLSRMLFFYSTRGSLVGSGLAIIHCLLEMPGVCP
jgi:hypothetical protein